MGGSQASAEKENGKEEEKQGVASVVSFPNKYIQQRLMTSEGRISTHNLYGNLTGVQNRNVTAIGSGSSSVHHSKGGSRDDELD